MTDILEGFPNTTSRCFSLKRSVLMLKYVALGNVLSYGKHLTVKESLSIRCSYYFVYTLSMPRLPNCNNPDPIELKLYDGHRGSLSELSGDKRTTFPDLTCLTPLCSYGDTRKGETAFLQLWSRSFALR